MNNSNLQPMKRIQIAGTGFLICIGLIVLGVYINKGLQSFSNKERVVTVKGLAEKKIKATAATITINSSFSGDLPNELVSYVNNQTNQIAAYLKEQKHSDLKILDPDIYDSKTYYDWTWRDGKQIQVKKDRYRVSQNIVIPVSDVEKAEKISKKFSLNLIAKNYAFDISCSYTFPELNDIKPELIAESTQNARLAGEQFAKDSQSKLGKIKTASQGQITIAGRNYYYDEESTLSAPAEPYFEKVRVVSTIVFFLED